MANQKSCRPQMCLQGLVYHEQRSTSTNQTYIYMGSFLNHQNQVFSLTSTCKKEGKEIDFNQFYVCNPIIQWHLKLPQFLPGFKVHYVCSSLVYDNSKVQGCDHITKVRQKIAALDPVSYKCGIFTLEAKKRVLDVPIAFNLTPCQPLSIDGALHWVVYIIPEERKTELDGWIHFINGHCKEEGVVYVFPIQSPTIYWTCGLCMNDPVKEALIKQFLLLDEDFLFYPLLVMENPASPVIIFLCNFKKELIFYNLDSREFKVEHKGIVIFLLSTTL
ncbi:hypothetical protein NE237_004830 [Protea cynaroides]|uniref:Uncharacterized protein n=1 Tax=Protea cynaroides TaxID=273540 RepID=A0A9Q0KK41_9MAGN|nr:hypothetical protein NE237_004830 [Protea cynaroides]